MKMVPLGEIANLDFGAAFKASNFNTDDAGLPVVRIRDVKRGYSKTYYSGVYDDKHLVQNDDYLIGMDGEFNLGQWRGGLALLNQRVCRISARSSNVDIGYLVRLLRLELKKIEDRTSFATVKHLSAKTLRALEVPLPPFDEQRRIAAILDKADAIRQKRRQAIAHLDTLTQSIFNEMFGEEERANFELREICTLRSGGTPSKQENGFWNGDIPWFSLKDLKHDRLTDSIDHVTERSIQQTTLRTIAKDTILVGVRGMVLAHTVPISLLKVDGTINQDVKALEVAESFTPEFLHAAMKGNHSYLLSQVTTAAHGTKRLESNALLSARIPCATSAEQIDFTSKIAHWAAARDRIKQLASGGDQLFASVQSRAFRGEL